MKLFEIHVVLCYIWILTVLVTSRDEDSASSLEDATDESLPQLSPDMREPTEEDKYVHFFDNDPHWYHSWALMAKAYREKGEEPLKKLCQSAHKRAGMGKVVVSNASMDARVLKFKNENYSPMKVDVITYEIIDEEEVDPEMNRFYITEGIRADCVFYVSPIANTNRTEFHLYTPVCGLHIE